MTTRLFVSPTLQDTFANRVARVEILQGNVVRIYFTIENPPIEPNEPNVDEAVAKMILPMDATLDLVTQIAMLMGWDAVVGDPHKAKGMH